MTRQEIEVIYANDEDVKAVAIMKAKGAKPTMIEFEHGGQHFNAEVYFKVNGIIWGELNGESRWIDPNKTFGPGLEENMK